MKKIIDKRSFHRLFCWGSVSGSKESHCASTGFESLFSSNYSYRRKSGSKSVVNSRSGKRRKII